MTLWRRFVHGLRKLFDRERSRDLGDEVAHYLEEAAAEYRARGHSPAEARRLARLEVGPPDSLRDEVGDHGWEAPLLSVATDLKYAVRRLRLEPTFTAVVVLTLALGLGGATAIFSAIKPILIEPLPYPDPERVAAIWEVDGNGVRGEASYGMYRELDDRSSSFQAVAAMGSWQPTMTGPDQPERLEGQRVSASYFAVLGIAPALGRAFEAAEDRPGGGNLVVLSDALWRRRFGGDSGVVGTEITLDDEPYLVVGVMPARFENLLAPEATIWTPLQYDMTQGRAWGHHLRLVGRLGAERTAEAAREELGAVGRAVLRDLSPPTYGDRIDFTVVPLRDDLVSEVRLALLAIAAAMTLVLVIACVNVANLLVARDARRRDELAVRVALGAGHGRVMRQLLTESILLAAIGGLAGLSLALVGTRALVVLAPASLPRVEAIALDGQVFGFAFLLTVIVGLAFGAMPARRAAKRAPASTMQLGSRRLARRSGRGTQALVAAELAIALVLLISSALLQRSVQRLLDVDPGFEAPGALTMQIQTAGRRLAADEAARRFFDDALAAVRGVPGVRNAALVSQLPLGGDADRYGVDFDPPLGSDPGEFRGVFRYAVSPGYLGTLGIPLLEGRLLDERDRAGAPLAAVLSASLAARRLPGLDPIGRRFRIGSGPLYTVVGVVGDVRQLSLATRETDAVYVTEAQWRFADRAMSLVVRTDGDPLALASAIRRAVWSVDKDQPIVRVATLQALVERSAGERGFVLMLFRSFALIALALTAIGVYGTLASQVGERTREIGIRAALGASRRQVIGEVVRRAATLAAIGTALGAGGALVATRLLTHLLFEISPLDPVSYLGAIGLLLGVALVAALVPAWRAARIDPLGALRSE
ncbi:MAG: ADOP family duplicated permease [Gemmatimonadales bacterium]